MSIDCGKPAIFSPSKERKLEVIKEYEKAKRLEHVEREIEKY
jgi:hypothetical protein